MKETADFKEIINIPRGLSEKTDGTKTSRNIKSPAGGIYRGELRLSSWYENIRAKSSSCLIMLVPFVACPRSSLCLEWTQQEAGEDAVPLENRLPESVFLSG